MQCDQPRLGVYREGSTASKSIVEIKTGSPTSNERGGGFTDKAFKFYFKKLTIWYDGIGFI